MAKNRNYPWYEIEKVSDLRNMIENSGSRFATNPAFLFKKGGKLQSISYREFKDGVFALGAGLLESGFGPGQSAALLSESRWEWGLCFLAVACTNGTNVPLDKDLKAGDLRFILEETGAQVLFTSARYLDLALELQTQLPCLQQVVCLDRVKPPENAAGGKFLSLADLTDAGARLLKQGRSRFTDLKIDPHVPVSIVYTSGTMGSAKGVVLSQHNIVSNMTDMCQAVYIDDKDLLLSVLPLNHTYESTCGLLTPLYRGSSVYYSENLRQVANQMQEVRATVILGVPLLFQAIYRKIMEGVREKGTGKFKAAKAAASLSSAVLGNSARRFIFSAVHKKFGGRLRLLISGGAASDPEVARLFRTLGIKFIQGYGLTECSPILAVNRPDFFKDDAAGYPLPSVRIRIAEDQEICAQGPNIMSGYYQKPEATAEVVQDGWFYTGDLGYLDDDGFLHIHGRKKAVIVLSSGKNVYAEEVEACLNRSPFVLESLAWEGPEAPSGKVDEVHATIVPNREEFDRHCKEKGLQLSDQLVEDVLKQEIRKQCAVLPYYKRVRKFTIRWEEFDKTTSRKIKRYLYTEKVKRVGEKASN
ncbi:MAG: long-chain fatty acid--CoA ligase [Acidobacteria bacterium]|nr:MAG: long-chain fatty acid--CoA ligase [Acidobacteriota bacterium]